jgi:hypothetical protein
MTDLRRQQQNAEWALSIHETGPIAELATFALEIIANPTLLVPASHAIVRKPELLTLGIPAERRDFG